MHTNGIPAVLVEKTSFAPSFRGEWHHNGTAQLVYPGRGAMKIHTSKGSWVIPPLRACWLPAFEPHRVETSTRLEMLSIYCNGPVLSALPEETGVVPVSRLLRELILAMHAMRRGEMGDEQFNRMVMVLADQIKLQPVPKFAVPPSLSPRLKPIQDALARDPADSRTLKQWSDQLGISRRTLARLFEQDARITFVEYRRQVRLHAALIKLAAGEPVTSIAYELGFSSASNFIAMFREATGVTPKRYFS